MWDNSSARPCPGSPACAERCPPNSQDNSAFSGGNGGAQAGPGSWGQLYGNDSSSSWSCPVLAEGGEQAPLAGGEAEKKWIRP